ncbi:MAG: DUF4019 domain-containing protein [Gemmatimonadota bacterium]
MKRRIWYSVLFAAVVVARMGSAQEASVAAPLQTAEPVAVSWLQLVMNGASDEAFDAASPLFQQRVRKLEWGSWVRAQQPRLAAIGPRRVVGTSYSKDESYTPPVEWANINYASDLPAGGILYQRFTLVRQLPSDWEVADYSLSKDARSALTSAYFDVIPYNSALLGYGYFPLHQRFVRRVAPRQAPPAPPPPRNIVLPKRPPT